MSDRSDFASDPKTFMETNVVFPLSETQSRPFVVTIQEIPGRKVVNRRGGKVFKLTTDCAGCSRAEKIPIHWVGYTANSVVQGVLNAQASYVFTFAMDGCTLGVGSQSGDGACVVSHANASSGGGGSDAQRDRQRGQLATHYGDNDFSVVSPLQYRATSEGALNFKSTTFGRLENGYWQFYVHRWMDNGGQGRGVFFDEFAMKMRGMNYIHGGVQRAVTIAAGNEETLKMA